MGNWNNQHLHLVLFAAGDRVSAARDRIAMGLTIIVNNSHKQRMSWRQVFFLFSCICHFTKLTYASCLPIVYISQLYCNLTHCWYALHYTSLLAFIKASLNSVANTHFIWI